MIQITESCADTLTSPAECRDNCIRPDVPCPFAADGICPGGSFTT